MLKRYLKNERGLTLIELLAVVVILGIIAAIAVPSIGGLIDNSKKDAHVANAQQMINSAKIAVTGDSSLLPTTSTPTKDISLKDLIDKGYIEDIKDPDSGKSTKDAGDSGYDGYIISGSGTSHSFVRISTTDGIKFTYSVKLVNNKRVVKGSLTDGLVEEKDLSRDSVVKKS